MLRLILTFIALLLFTSSGHAAIQLGDSLAKIVAQYVQPTDGNPNAKAVTYQWAGWHLHVDFIQDTAQRLEFIKDTAFISDAEQRQLLNDKSGIASWQLVERLNTGPAAWTKWRRTTDGAEAFASGQTFTLFTKLWMDTQVWNAKASQRHAPAPSPSRIVVTVTAVDPLLGMLSRLTMMAGVPSF